MCDSMVASADMARDGYTIFAKASDRACNEAQYFVYVPAADHAPGQKVRCTLIEIEQATHTNAVMLSKPSWVWGCEIGVNEYGVCTGNESVFSKEMNTTTDGLFGMDICRIALERAKTAQEAVEVMAEMMERYGQGGNASFDSVFYYDNGYLITDPNESWHFETAGNLWAAKKISGSYSISNYLSIATPDLMHRDLVQTAIDRGYPVSEPFDFAESYMNWNHPVNVSGMVRRSCSYRLMQKSKKCTVGDMVAALRSHTTDKPWTGGGKSVCMHASHPTSSDDVSTQTTNCMIAVCKPGDTTMWGPGMSISCIAPFQPFWFDAYSSKLVFAYDKQEEAMDSWLKREQLNRAMLDGKLPEAAYKAELHNMQNRWFEQVEAVSRGDRQALCDQIADEAEMFVDKWLKITAGTVSKPMGSAEFQKYWSGMNAALGKNRTIAY